MIHRDLKPSNVLMSETGVAAITDFGLAQFNGSKGGKGHTVAYASPEQLDGAEVTSATDIYSWGAMRACSAWKASVVHRERAYRHMDCSWDRSRPVRRTRCAITRCLDRFPDRRPTIAVASAELKEIAGRLSEQKWAHGADSLSSIEEIPASVNHSSVPA